MNTPSRTYRSAACLLSAGLVATIALAAPASAVAPLPGPHVVAGQASALVSADGTLVSAAKKADPAPGKPDKQTAKEAAAAKKAEQAAEKAAKKAAKEAAKKAAKLYGPSVSVKAARALMKQGAAKSVKAVGAQVSYLITNQDITGTVNVDTAAGALAVTGAESNLYWSADGMWGDAATARMMAGVDVSAEDFAAAWSAAEGVWQATGTLVSLPTSAMSTDLASTTEDVLASAPAGMVAQLSAAVKSARMKSGPTGKTLTLTLDVAKLPSSAPAQLTAAAVDGVVVAQVKLDRRNRVVSVTSDAAKFSTAYAALAPVAMPAFPTEGLLPAGFFDTLKLALDGYAAKAQIAATMTSFDELAAAVSDQLGAGAVIDLIDPMVLVSRDGVTGTLQFEIALDGSVTLTVTG